MFVSPFLIYKYIKNLLERGGDLDEIEVSEVATDLATLVELLGFSS